MTKSDAPTAVSGTAHYRQPWIADTLAVLVSLGVLAFALPRALGTADAPPRAEDNRPTVGTLTSRVDYVRRRPENSLAWYTADTGQSIQLRDAIFVGDNSAARVKLEDGSWIDVDENSLVVVEGLPSDENDNPTVRLVSGTASPKAGSRPLTMQTAGGVVSLEAGSRANVRTNRNGAPRLEMVDGAGALRTDDGELRVSEGQQTTASGVRDLTIELLEPAPDEPLRLATSPAAARFEWRGPKSKKPYVFELSNDAAFEDIHTRAKSKKRAVMVSALVPGVYYWRVRSGAKDASREQRLLVERERIPVLAFPAVDAIVTPDASGAVELQWSGVPGAPAYEVQLATDTNFGEMVHTAELNATHLNHQFPAKEAGYCFRVRISGDERARWSAGRCFRVVLRPVLEAPEVEKPRREVVPTGGRPRGSWIWHLFGSVAHAAEAKSAIVLRWRKTSGAVAYMLEIAEDEDFKRIVVNERVETTYYRWNTVARRNYWYRVRGIDAQGREGVASTPVKIASEVSSLGLVAPKDKQRVMRGANPPKIEFRWRKSDVIIQYVLQVATTPSFSKATTTDIKTTRPAATYTAKTVGPLYWRVYGIDLNGDRTPNSAVRTLDIFVKAPSPARPTAGHVAPLAEPTISLELTWQRRAVATYTVQVARDRAFKKPVTQQQTKTANATIELSQLGNYHWRVRGESPKTSWSVISNFRVGPRAPVAVEPVADAVVEIESDETSLTFAFEPVPAVTKYRLELTSAADDAVIRTVDIQETTTAIDGIVAGSYRWTVRAVGPEGEPGPASAPWSIEVKRKRVVEEIKVAKVEPPKEEKPKTDIKEVAVAPAEEDDVFFLGPRIGFIVNLGQVVAPRFGAQATMLVPVFDWSIAITAAAEYYIATKSIGEDTGPQFGAELHVVPIELFASWVFDFDWFQIAAGAGVSLAVSSILIKAEGAQTLAQTTFDAGGVLVGGAQLPLGPGNLFAHLSFSLTSRSGGEIGDAYPGGLGMALGYQIGVF